MSHYVDEDGLLHVVDETLDTDVIVYARLQGGVLHVMGRAPDKATFDQEALAVGLVQYENPEVLDEEGNVIEPASGELVPVQGATINGIGAYMTQPPGLDQDGNPATPPVFDERWHFNFWLDSTLVAKGAWETWIQQWMNLGTPGSNPNKNERAVVLKEVQLIDPTTVASPGNVLL